MPADFASASGGAGNEGVAFLVAAGIVMETIAFACSSPQTAELNIKTRGETLFKWVHMGEALGGAFVLAAAFLDPAHTAPILAGGAVAIIASEAYYRHARASGLRNPGPPTEQEYTP